MTMSIQEEIGDLLFAIVNLSRFLKRGPRKGDKNGDGEVYLKV